MGKILMLAKFKMFAAFPGASYFLNFSFEISKGIRYKVTICLNPNGRFTWLEKSTFSFVVIISGW